MSMDSLTDARWLSHRKSNLIRRGIQIEYDLANENDNTKVLPLLL